LTYEIIKNRFTGEILCGGLSLKAVVEKHGKWLRHERGGKQAELIAADLRGADFRDLDLRGAVLAEADLGGSDFRRANLLGITLVDADCSNSRFGREVDFSGADLTGANLNGSDLAGAGSPAPAIKNIHQAVYAAASRPGCLDMDIWHTCATTHCRAGWVVHLAGKAGYALEEKTDAQTAAVLIYLKSDPEIGKIPDFYADSEEVMKDMERLAASSAMIAAVSR
jgi:Pentapeptide repeats (8 copies)